MPTEHLPLVAGTPGLRATEVRRVSGALGGETDLVLVTAMQFDDRAALDAGLASDAMRAAGRNLREIAPGLATLLVLEDAPDLWPGSSSRRRAGPFPDRAILAGTSREEPA